MNDETAQPVVPRLLDLRRRWTQTDGEHYRAIVRAGTETLAILTADIQPEE